MKNKTLVLLAVLTSLLMTYRSEAQDHPSRIKEFGVGLSSLNSFSLQYRWGNENRLFRFTGNIGAQNLSIKSTDDSEYPASGTSTSSTSKTTSPIDLSLGVSFSILKIKYVTEKFGFMYGGIIAFSYGMSMPKTDESSNVQYSDETVQTTTKETDQAFRPSIGMALGAVYKISPSFLVYAEIDPQIFYAYQNSTQKVTTTIYYTGYPDETETKIETLKNPRSTFGINGLSNNFASLTFVYRFSK